MERTMTAASRCLMICGRMSFAVGDHMPMAIQRCDSHRLAHRHSRNVVCPSALVGRTRPGIHWEGKRGALPKPKRSRIRRTSSPIISAIQLTRYSKTSSEYHAHSSARNRGGRQNSAPERKSSVLAEQSSCLRSNPCSVSRGSHHDLECGARLHHVKIAWILLSSCLAAYDLVEIESRPAGHRQNLAGCRIQHEAGGVVRSELP